VSLEEDRAKLSSEVERLKAELEKQSRRLERIDSVQDLKEFPPGTVIQFSRTLPGGPKKYTFVAFRTWAGDNAWSVTGKKNVLNLIHLSDAGNSWEDLLLAIGKSTIKRATNWSAIPDEGATRQFDYYKGLSSHTFYRVDPRTGGTQNYVNWHWLNVGGDGRRFQDRVGSYQWVAEKDLPESMRMFDE
jgi:hypothetical protein